MSATVRRLTLTLVLLALASLAASSLQAQPPNCGQAPTGRPWGCALPTDYPPAVRPVGGVLDTSLVMRERDLYVPVWTANLCKGTLNVCVADADCGGAAGSCANAQVCRGSGTSCTGDGDCGTDGKCIQTWGWQLQHLRPYGSPVDPARPIDPKNPNDPNLRWGYPGPILHARATTLKDPAQRPGPANPVVSQGSRIKVKLYNYLPPQSYQQAEECNPASYRLCTNRVCSNADTKVCTKDSDCGSGNTCNPASICSPFQACADPQGPCGSPRPVPQMHPNCFHGNNVTNFHLHGTHASPQAHQDYVLLNLFPFGSTGVPTGKEEYAVGDYQVDVNPLPWNQAPGTHWYHPHKHGSTSLQVQGGEAGALIVEGAFDDWLNALYQGRLVDRVMAVQQIVGQNNFFNPGTPNVPPQLLLNGFATPVIKMRPGEIQRLRFVGGTTQSAAALEVGFDPRVEIRQIAQDGIQFAWENYDRQPLRDSAGTYENFRIAPGNRADFLVKAPDTPGTFSVTRRVFLEKLPAQVEKILQQRGFDPHEAMALRPPPLLGLRAATEDRTPPVDQNGSPVLFTIEVSGPALPMSFPVTEGTEPACKAQPRPARCWPATPYYLKDLAPAGTPAAKLAFQIDGEPASQPNSFSINGKQYDPSCAGVSMARGATEDWLIANAFGNNNTTELPHPFHIHTNPFQVIRNADRSFTPPYIWQDTIALPVPGQADRPAGPIWNNDDAKVKCPTACDASNATWNGQWTTTIPGKMSVCGCVVKSSDVAIRQRFDDYTGAYVIHCHFLGHEDRGMMWNVQTVCEAPANLRFGQTQASGAADNCQTTSPARPKCPYAVP